MPSDDARHAPQTLKRTPTQPQSVHKASSQTWAPVTANEAVQPQEALSEGPTISDTTGFHEWGFYCPYHGPILRLRSIISCSSGYNLSPMERFLAEDPSEQGALFNRPDMEKTTFSNTCICNELIMNAMAIANSEK